MDLSGIELRYLISEINAKITSEYYVSSIAAVTRDSFLFRMHHSTEPDIVLMLSVRGVWLTRFKFAQVEESDLISIIRHEVERAKIEAIEQSGSERIITTRFRHFDGKSRIIVAEVFGVGNIILCDENMQILAILNPLQVRHRVLKKGYYYFPPPNRGTDILDITLEQLQIMRNSTDAKDLDVPRWLGRNISIPKKFVEEIVRRAGISASNIGQLSEGDMSRICRVIKELVSDISTGSHKAFVILGEDGKARDAVAIPTTDIPFLRSITTTRMRTAHSYMEAVDEVLANEITERHSNSKTTDIDKKIAILEHDLEEQNRAKDEVISKAAIIRKFANDLMAISLEGINNTFDGDSVKEFLGTYSALIVTDKGRKYLELLGERVPTADSSMAKISSLLFGRAKELERGCISIEDAKAKLHTQLGNLRNQTTAIQDKTVIKEQIAKEWYERYRWFITSEGLLAIGGRDASSNSAIIRKHLREEDIVFHAEVHGSPFFILKAAKRVSEISASRMEVAQATVSFSRAWKDGLFSADAFWVEPSQIKRGAPTGQFLPRGSFVIEGKRNYIKGIEIKLAVGLIRSYPHYVLACGPTNAIKKRSVVYSQLLPGGMDPNSVAKKIKTDLVKAAYANTNTKDDTNAQLADFTKSINIGDFIRAIPSGHSKIFLTERGEGEGISLTKMRINEQSN
ncbi:MAG TPA: ribosome rescue protein RqcH [Candidatus Nitrosopolaris sp.]|nr:ribosome rescue protein RqcH [Candidatus Nitrosopolaris sp.]